MNSTKRSLVLVISIVMCFEADAQTTAPSVPWITTRPARTQPKGGPPATMPAEAKTVMDRFSKAVGKNDWEKALSYCTRRTQSRASKYGPEEYIARFVPIAKLQAEPNYKFWTYSQNRPGGEYEFFGCFLRLLDGPDGETVNWEWWLERTAHGWVIDLPDVPVDRWIEEEIDRFKRLKEKHEARWRALEPKLKGLRTQLTALQQEYRVGQPMPFRLELVNEGEHELSYDKQRVAVNGSMIIKNENQQVMPYIAGPFQTGGGLEPIKPGESV